ncbi:hypothetical protein [Arthrobacter cupressi]
MTQMNPAPENEKQGTPTSGAGQSSPAAGTGAQSGGAQSGGASAAQAQAGRAQAVAGPFTVRDIVVFAAVLLLFVASLLPMFGPYNLWSISNLFFLGLGIILPVTVAGLFVTRRLQPQSPLRIGSLSVDQFASVVGAFSGALYFLTIVVDFSAWLLLGLFGALALLAATVLAPHLPILRDDFKGRAESAAHLVARDAVEPVRKPAAPKPAKKTARPAAVPAAAGPVAGAPASGGPFAVVPTPAAPVAPGPAVAPAPSAAPGPAVTPERTAAPAPSAASATTPSAAAAPAAVSEPSAATGESRTEDSEGGTPAAGAAGTPEAPAAAREIPATMAHPVVDRARSAEPIGATVDPASRPEESEEPGYEAFWFAVPQPRVAVDEHTGAPAFTVEPGGWVLALEDRGEEFLVQNTDGRLGVLRDLSHIERG